MSFTTYSDVSSLINTIYTDALRVAREQTIMDMLVTTFSDRQGLAPRSVTQYGQVSINEIGESDDILPQQFSRSLLSTLTPAEKGAQFFLTDSRIESDPEDVRRDAAIELGGGIATKIETDILGNFSSLTGGTIGAAGSTLVWGHFFGALSILRANLAPFPYVCVMHPYQWNVLGKAVAPPGAQTNAPEFQDAVMENFWVSRVSGVDIFISSNIAIDGNGDATAAMFARPAIAYDNRRAPRLEPERDASRRAWELNMTSVYAHGVWRPTYGVQMISDASTPS